MDFNAMQKEFITTFKDEMIAFESLISQQLEQKVKVSNSSTLSSSPLLLPFSFHNTIILPHHITKLVAIYKKKGWENVEILPEQNLIKFHFSSTKLWVELERPYETEVMEDMARKQKASQKKKKVKEGMGFDSK